MPQENQLKKCDKMDTKKAGREEKHPIIKYKKSAKWLILNQPNLFKKLKQELLSSFTVSGGRVGL